MMKTLTIKSIWMFIIPAFFHPSVYAEQSFSRKEMLEVERTIQEMFNSDGDLKNMPSWCTRESSFEVGPIFPEFYVDLIAFTSDNSIPATIAPYLKDSGIYNVAVLVENKGCFVNKVRRNNVQIKWVGASFCNSCADQMVEVTKRIKEKTDIIDKVVCLSCITVNKILIIYKDGTEEYFSNSTRGDLLPNTTQEIREYLRDYLEAQRGPNPYKSATSQ